MVDVCAMTYTAAFTVIAIGAVVAVVPVDVIVVDVDSMVAGTWFHKQPAIQLWLLLHSRQGILWLNSCFVT